MRRCTTSWVVTMALAVGSVVGGAAGCAAEMAAIGPEPVVMVSIEPGDGVTAWQGRDVMVAVEDPAHLLNPEGRADLANRFQLRTWPELTSIPITTEILPGTTEWQWALRVTPSLTLDDGWFVINAPNLSPRIVSAAKLPDGTIGARFSSGSHPHVAAVQICEKEGAGEAAGMKVAVSFSEPVALPSDGADAVSLKVNGQPAPCVSSGGAMSAVYMNCSELTPASSVTVSTPTGLVTAGGVPLENGRWTIELAKLPPGGCQTYKPPLGGESPAPTAALSPATESPR